MSEPLEIQPVVRPVCGIADVPGSKSITNRALVLAALAHGTSTLRNALFSDDTHYMSDALRALGITVDADELGAAFRVEGCGGQIEVKNADLFVGNAGTAARFLTAFCSLGRGRYHIDGVGRMRERPIEDLLEALRQLGVDARSDFGTGCPPLTINANGLRGGRITLRAGTSSQYLTALLLVSPLVQEQVIIELGDGLASRPYVEMTLRMMDDWGANVYHGDDLSSFRIPGGQSCQAREYMIEPDASSASYFFAAAAVTGGTVRVNGIGRNSLQGDTAFVDVLRQMGCRVERALDYLEVQGFQRLSGVNVDMNGISDTVMTLGAIAPFADSPTNIRNVAHIRHKETDRISALTSELRRLGVTVDERDDGLTIHPAASLSPAEIETYDDHRMAMSFAVTGLRAPGIKIKDPDCVSKTFPDFFPRLRRLAGQSA